jgi:hypothetical protein
MEFWKIAPGEEGYLWVEQRDNNCIAIGWNKVGNLNKYKNDAAIRKRFYEIYREEGTTPRQLLKFYRKVRKGDKVVASSGEDIYGIGTINGNYKFNEKLEYKHSKPVVWEFTFWEPLDVGELPLSKKLKKRLGLNRTVLPLTKKEWDTIYKIVSQTKNPFKGLTNWEGLPRAPQTEQEVVILFSKLSNVLKMKIEYVSTRFPDATIMIKRGGEWITKKAEFEVYSSGFQKHLEKMRKKKVKCDYVICWEDDDWKQKPKNLRVIELKKELEKII